MAMIAAVQMASGSHVPANLMEAGRLIKEAAAQGAQMVVLPETFAIMGARDEDRVEVAEEPGNGPMQNFLGKAAKMHSVWIVGGTIPLKSDDPRRAWASSLMYNDQGEMVARYDKIHLFDVEIAEPFETYTESHTTRAGNKHVVVDTPLGKIGMAVCYDLRFPGQFRQMMDEGAEIFVAPSAFTETTGKAHWEILLRARAIENLCYMVAPAQGGYHVNGCTTYGHSMMVDFWGNKRDELGKGTGIIMMEIDRNAQMATRKAFPVLNHRMQGD